MVKIHNLGYPRMGAKRELKFALERYWKGESTLADLKQTGAELRHRHWRDQSMLDFVPVGDFSFYDHVLDMSFTLGNLPERVSGFSGDALDNSFRVARGRSANAAIAESESCGCGAVAAGEMTKWLDTNYHYIVPEYTAKTRFELDPSRLLEQIQEAQEQGHTPKPVLLGPVSYLALGKSKDGSHKLQLLPELLHTYKELLEALSRQNIEWVQIDEPILVTDLDAAWVDALQTAYQEFSACRIKLLLTCYFGQLRENLTVVAQLPVSGVHLDAVNAWDEVETLIDSLPQDRIVSLGIINGRNVWKSDLVAILDGLEPLVKRLKDRLWLAPSCSLLHVPADLESEAKLDPEIRSWLAFAKQKLVELEILGKALNEGRESVREALRENAAAMDSRRNSSRVHQAGVQEALKTISPELGQRKSHYAIRAELQSARLQLPRFPTTTIGSFPQTQNIRNIRSQYKKGKLDEALYTEAMRHEIAQCVKAQESLGLDVLVHGEPERNDMVEYFGEQLNGYAFTEFGWVQSYGSRCVKPPILFGDISRPKAMTVDWMTYAQSLTSKPMKGMLTGPVTLLNWSFVRDDQPRSTTCKQLALAIREEVLDLERVGIAIVQIDEAALREGLPLRRSQWQEYLDWAVESFRITANGVADETQIHTHMCYSEFNDIIASIAAMDADVITIETSRSDMELLDVFDDFQYPNAIGPGVYDIHSPNIPTVESIVNLMEKAASRIASERLWVNPDCGLKTRQWKEVIPSLTHMVDAARKLRESALVKAFESQY